MKLTTQDKILDISVNLARVSEWILSENKKNRVDQFLKESQKYLSSISKGSVSKRFLPTLALFKKEFKKLVVDRNKADKEEWAERVLTWANILQHRARLA